METGIFTQTLCLLLKAPATLDRIAQILAEYEISGRNDTSESWEFSGPALIIAHRPEVDGYVVVDLVDQPWPDDMGYEDQKSLLFGAWKSGQFGPFTFPASLERATEQSWGWPEGKTEVAQHKCFVRIRSSYVLGKTEDNDEWLPEDYDPVDELEFMTGIAEELLKLPEVLCFFNPNGEVLRDRATFEESVKVCGEHEIPTVDLWTNVRLFRFDEEWAMMDTVGNSQLGFSDIEACFYTEAHDYNNVDQLLRMVTMYLVGGEEFESGETIEDEEGMSWQMSFHEDSLCDPPRDVLRLLPADGHPVPDAILSNDAGPE